MFHKNSPLSLCLSGLVITLRLSLQVKLSFIQSLTFLSESPDTVSIYCSWIMKAARLAVYEAKKMTAKKAQTRTMILLVVPLGFSMGTELLKTMPHSSHTDFPMVNVGPPGAEETEGGESQSPVFNR